MLTSFFLSLTGIIILFIIFLVLIKSEKKQSDIIFVFVNISVLIWIIMDLIFYNINDNLYFWARNTYFSALFIPIFYFQFVRNFLSKTKTDLKSWALVFIPHTFLILAILFWPSLMFTGDSPPWEFGFLYYVYSFYISAYFIASYFILIKNIKKHKGLLGRQLSFIFYGSFASSFPAIIFALVLPVFGIYSLYFFSPGFSIILSLFITAAIFRHGLFNIKLVTMELFTLIIWIFVFIRILTSSSLNEVYTNSAFFILTLVIGVLLIRNANKLITQRERAEDLAEDLEKTNEILQEVNRKEKNFLSFASRRFKAPLASIKGYASLIIDESFGKISDAVYEAVRKISISANSMNRSVNDFLNVSRIEQGRLEYDKEIFDISKTVEEVITELKLKASKKNIFVKIKKSDETNFNIEVDKIKIEQIMTNLIDNAVKYTNEGGVEVSILKQKKEGEEKILIAVKDSGIGMNQETIDILFQKYNRAKSAKKKKIEGTGLGLYIAKQMVEGMEGRVWAESEGEGEGSVFYVELPAV